MNRNASFLDELAEGSFLLDGAMGSSLLATGDIEMGEVALAVIRHPERVREIHRSFLDAGSRWLLTHTFGANACAVEANASGLSVERLNSLAVKLARDEASAVPGTWVAGNIGPASLWLPKEARPELAELRGVYDEQAAALANAGVDLFCLETFGGSGEALIAMQALERYSLPIVASLTFTQQRGEYQTLEGGPLLAALQELEAGGAAAVGINCAGGSAQVLECARHMIGHVDVPFFAKPNAGKPVPRGKGTAYLQDRAEFASHMQQAVELGVAAVGGCCGADSSYIASLGRALRGA